MNAAKPIFSLNNQLNYEIIAKFAAKVGDDAAKQPQNGSNFKPLRAT